MKPLTFIATVLSLAFLGCASSPEERARSAIDTPEKWTVEDLDSTTTEAWLDDFNDPSLEALVDEALANNPDLRAVAARFAQTVAEARINGADRLPSANLGLGAARQKVNTIGPQSISTTRFENYDLNLNLSWEVDLWGKLNDRNSAALARVDASAADLRNAELSLAAQVVKGWFNYVEAEAQFQLAEDTAESWQENLQALESRFSRGLSDGLDLRRIRTQTAGAEAQVETTRRTRDAIARSLETLLGRYPSASIDRESELPPLPAPVPVGLPADLLTRRPDLIAAERQLAASDKELSASRKELLPSISLTASGGTNTQEFDDILDSDFSVWTLAGNLAQPVFQGGRIRAGIDRSKALRIQAAENYRETALRAFREVETTLAAEVYLQIEYEKLRIAADEAVAAEELAWARYRNGTSDFLNALDSQRTATTALGRLLTLRNFLLQNRVDLYLALGGPFETES